MKIPARIAAALFGVLLLTSAPVAASTIIGRFDLNSLACDDIDEFCISQEYFSISSDLVADPLTFYATVVLGDGSAIALLDDSGDGVLAAGESAISFFQFLGTFEGLNTT